LDAEYKQLDKADKTDYASQPNHPPVGRRYVLAFGLFVGGFLLSLYGWLHFNDYRRVFCTALIGSGWLLSGLGLGFWFATFSYRQSWGWIF